MKRRNFLSLFLLAPTAVWAEDGLLIDVGESASGSLLDTPHQPNDLNGLLIDSVKKVQTQEKPIVHLYSPETWVCGACNSAEKALKTCPRVSLKIHKQDQLEGFFAGKSFPVLHWSAGDGWQEGWEGLDPLLKKIFKDSSKTIGFSTIVHVTSKGPIFHNGHDCPSCNRVQFQIENDSGPSHTHRCSSCSTTWYHADSNQQRSNGSFLFWHW